MKKQIHPAVAVALVVLVAVTAVYIIFKGMEPQREPNPLSQQDIYKQMRDFNAGKRPGAPTPPGK